MSTNAPSTAASTTLPGWLNTFAADTLGTVYRAATGKVDPFTQDEITTQGINDCVTAGGDPSTCADQQTTTVQKVLDTQTTSWSDAAKLSASSLSADNGSGCGITNLGGCLPWDPSYTPYIFWGGLILLGLLILRPYVELLEE